MSDAYTNRLNDTQNELAHRMDEILDAAAAENRDLTPEENENLTKWDADYDRVAADKKRLLDIAEKTKASDAFRAAIEPVLRESRIVTPEMDERKRLIKIVNGESWQVPTRNVEGVPFFHSDGFLNSMEARALQSAGGSAVPTVFADFVTVYERTLNPTLALARVISGPSGEPFVFPRLTADTSAGGSVTAEAGGITVGDATISSVTINVYKKAWISAWSAELNQDNVIGLEGLIAEAISRPLGINWGSAFTVGTAAADGAEGFIKVGTNGGTAQGTADGTSKDTFFGWTDLVDLLYGLPAPYRLNSTFQASNTALAKIRKFRDSTNAPIWSAPIAAGQPELVLGRPIYENPAMAAVASASKSVACGDFSQYIVRSVEPMRVDLSSEFYFGTDSLALRVVTRRGGDLPDTTAIRFLVSAGA